MKYIFLMIVLGLPLTVFGDGPSADAETCACGSENMDCSERGTGEDLPPAGGGTTGTVNGGATLK